MIKRNLLPVLRDLAGQMPAVAVTGPRQSGKTTLCKAAFPGHAYVSLEPLDVRETALSDPRGFLARHPGPVIFDEVQRAPELFSYLQEEIDRQPHPGRYILTGSQQFGLSDVISQSLAGRVGLLDLLPLSLDEVTRFPVSRTAGSPDDLWQIVLTGGYPRIYDQALDPGRWLADYTATYVQRDVRQVLNVTNLDAFVTFLRLIAGRTAQELHLSALGADVGVSYNTIRAWVSVLEAGFIIFRVPRWFRNLRKRAVKAPKIHFVDTGLACHLLGIRDARQLELHPLRGALFETWVASEILKSRRNRGFSADLFHLREARGAKIDLLVGVGTSIQAVEIKSGSTIASDFSRHVDSFASRAGADGELDVTPLVIYGGRERHVRGSTTFLPWSEVPGVVW